MLAICKRGKNTNLSASIIALNISLRISLGIAKLLSHFECICKRHLLTNHLCKNKVCCTIEYTSNLYNIICCKALAHWTDNWNATTYACLKEEVCVLFLCDCKKLCTFFSNKLFIRSYNAFACL